MTPISSRRPFPPTARHAARRAWLPVIAALGAAVWLVASAAAPGPPAARPAPTAAPKAATAARSAAVGEATRAAVARRIPGVRAEDVRPSPVPGILEVARGAEIFYVTADARHVFAGDLYDIDAEQNVSDLRRREARNALISSVPESQMISFGPRDAKYTVTVFTDIDCGFCRKLHNEVPKYNELGIRVRYLFYPRTGPNTASWNKAVSVWCAKDRNDALTRAKRGEEISAARCGKTPVDRDFEIGQEMPVTGTPAIVLPSGDMIEGYRAAPALLKLLQETR
jgi:thiol:disulfide interchange protein DsbC